MSSGPQCAGSEFQSGNTVSSLDEKSLKEKFLFGLFYSLGRIYSFFVLLPGMAAVTGISQAFDVPQLWDV